MKKLFIGVDISLNSTAVCFKHGDDIRFLTISSRNCYTTSKKKNVDEIISDNNILNKLDHMINILMVVTNRLPTSKEDSFEVLQRNQIRKAYDNAYEIYHSVCVCINEWYEGVHNKDIIISVESYSYGSIGDQLVQIVELSTLLKHFLIHNILGGNYDNFISIPGPKVKMFAGSGNYDKYMMLKAFNKIGLKDDFSIFVRDNHDLITETFIKPVKSNTTFETGDKLFFEVNKINYEIEIIGVNEKPKKGQKKYTVSDNGKLLFLNKPELIQMRLKKKQISVKTPINDIIDSYFIMACGESMVENI